MKSLRLSLALLSSIGASILVPEAASASSIDTLATVLGNYSVYVKGDMGSAANPYLSDSSGPIVAGGNVYLSNFSANTNQSGAPYGLIAGGNLVMNGGSVSGKNFYVGGTTTLSGGATVLGNLATTTLTAAGGNVYGNVTVAKNLTMNSAYFGGNGTVGGNLALNGGSFFTNSGATVTYGGALSGNPQPYQIANVKAGSANVSITAPINILGTYDELVKASKVLGGLAQTAGATEKVAYGNTLALTGTNPTLDVFKITSAQWNSTINTFTITAPSTATVIVDVDGSSFSLSGGFSLTGVSASHVLLNFTDASSISLSSIGVLGSILAPGATVSGTWGQIQGAVIAAAIQGSMQLNPPAFSGNLSAVPLPGALPLFASVLAGLGFLARRRAKKA